MENVIKGLLGNLYEETGMFATVIVTGKFNSRLRDKVEFERLVVKL